MESAIQAVHPIAKIQAGLNHGCMICDSFRLLQDTLNKSGLVSSNPFSVSEVDEYKMSTEIKIAYNGKDLVTVCIGDAIELCKQRGEDGISIGGALTMTVEEKA